MCNTRCLSTHPVLSYKQAQVHFGKSNENQKLINQMCATNDLNETQIIIDITKIQVELKQVSVQWAGVCVIAMYIRELNWLPKWLLNRSWTSSVLVATVVAIVVDIAPHATGQSSFINFIKHSIQLDHYCSLHTSPERRSSMQLINFFDFPICNEDILKCWHVLFFFLGANVL